LSVRLFLVLVLLCAILTACGSFAKPATSTEVPVSPSSAPTEAVAPTKQSITVFAAASLTEAFTELGKQFEAETPGAKLVFNFAGSQQLVEQLAQAAPADVFASANQAQMDAAVQAGRVAEGQPQPLVGNKLVVIFPSLNPGKLNQLQDLAHPGLKLVLADQAVPVGKYSLEFLDNASKLPEYGSSFKEDVLKNVVSYEENVRSVLAKVTLGEADAGIVYASDLISQPDQQVEVLQIPESLNVNALYSIAPVVDSQQAALARGFVDYALSPAGQELLARFGFKKVR